MGALKAGHIVKRPRQYCQGSQGTVLGSCYSSVILTTSQPLYAIGSFFPPLWLSFCTGQRHQRHHQITRRSVKIGNLGQGLHGECHSMPRNAVFISIGSKKQHLCSPVPALLPPASRPFTPGTRPLTPGLPPTLSFLHCETRTGLYERLSSAARFIAGDSLISREEDWSIRLCKML